MSQAVPEIDFASAETIQCPFHAYRELRDEAPVWKDPITSTFQVTRYEDVRKIVLDPENFPNGAGATSPIEMLRSIPDPTPEIKAMLELEIEIQKLYEEDGWVPTVSLLGYDGERHTGLRKLFDDFLKPARIERWKPHVADVANERIDGFIAKGTCDWTEEFSSYFPGYVMGPIIGVPREDIPMVKDWTVAWIDRLGMMQTPEERIESVRQEIQAQKYFYGLIQKVRETPDDSWLSHLVNTEVPAWGRKLNENEIMSELMIDVFVGGAETTTHALNAGMWLLAGNPEVQEKVYSDPEKYVGPFIEEVLRLETPAQGTSRTTVKDMELHGVHIPAGSTLLLRPGAANRDDRRYDNPDDIDLDRKNPRTHLTFTTGKHHCVGAPLARQELNIAFQTVTQRMKDITFTPDKNDFAVIRNYFMRGLKQLHIDFTAR
ncbi:MAG TPA: cytochrome P450 [Baekduia sp.]|uniref:cytochrome P450 n=1 Tax=Baekduia sp. TaxID=2600305 RepID=UPI002D7869F7|nr:cytochrome P450 [Baekduia sp.]HET6509154.1 cytochrome P450 [Baekduia sp.]